jgi:hypothetical protein
MGWTAGLGDLDDGIEQSLSSNQNDPAKNFTLATLAQLGSHQPLNH